VSEEMDLSTETFALLPLSSRRPPTPPPREDDDKEEEEEEDDEKEDEEEDDDSNDDDAFESKKKKEKKQQKKAAPPPKTKKAKKIRVIDEEEEEEEEDDGDAEGKKKKKQRQKEDDDGEASSDHSVRSDDVVMTSAICRAAYRAKGGKDNGNDEIDDGEEPLRYNNIQKLHTQPSALRLQLEVYQDRHTRPYPSRACECRSSDEPLPAGRDTTDRGFLGVE
jgi:outer membrane biosynthesis protein TonB